MPTLVTHYFKPDLQQEKPAKLRVITREKGTGGPNYVFRNGPIQSLSKRQFEHLEEGGTIVPLDSPVELPEGFCVYLLERNVGKGTLVIGASDNPYKGQKEIDITL